MHFLLHFGISIETLKKAFQHSGETIHWKVNEVFDIVQYAPTYLNLEEQESGSGKKRKQSQMAAKLGEFKEIRKIQMEKNQEKLDEKKKKGDEYSVQKCIAVVESMET